MYCSIQGGCHIRLHLEGFSGNLNDQVTSVVLRDLGGGIVHEKVFDDDDKWLTSGTSYLTFIAPSLSIIRDTDRHPYSTYTWGYDMALRITDHEDLVLCHVQNKCVLYFSYTYTPYIPDLHQPTQISDNRLKFRVMRQNGLNIQYQSQSGPVPLRHIKIQGQNCDFVTSELINSETYTHKWRWLPYTCDLTDFKFVQNGEFQHRDYTGDALVLESAYYYKFDGTRQLMKIFPTINYISNHIGNIGGGLDITVKGTGWNRDNTKIYVDGVECPLNSLPTFDADTGDFQATCKTKIAPVSSGTSHAGGHGIYRQLHANVYFTQMTPTTLTERRIAFNHEVPYNEVGYESDRYSSIQKTFFKPPIAGNKRYRFRLSQDDRCVLYIYDQQPNKIAASKDDMTLALEMTSWSHYEYFYQLRDANTGNFINISPWFTLNGNNLYYLETWMYNSSGASFCTLGVEIEHQVTDHPQNVPEVQKLSYTYNPTFDEYKIKLKKTGKPVDSVFKLVFKKDSQNGQVNHPVDNLKLNMTTTEFYNKVKSYFYDKFRTTFFDVFKNYLMQNGSPATGADDAAKLQNSDFVEFVIHMKTLHNGARESQTTGYPEIQSTVLNVGQSQSKFVQGDYPVKGKWRIIMTDPITNQQVQSAELSHGAQYYHVTDAMAKGVHEYLHALYCVRTTLKNADGSEKGYEYLISFDHYRKEVPQMDLNVTALYWESPNGVVNGVPQTTKNTNFQKQKSTVQPFSKNLLFIPAPYEFFRTPHAKPQVTVVSGDLLGVCDWNRTVSTERCDFEYKDSTPQVTSFTANADFTQVTLVGTSLDSGTISKRYWAGRECASYNPTTKVCTVTNPKAGSFKPELYETNLGYATVGGAAISIPPKVTSLQPTQINQQGGQTLTITGSRFPTDDTVPVTITVGGVECDGYNLISETQISCHTPEQAATGAKLVVVKVNNIASTDAVSVQVNAFSTSATVNPASARSTEKKNLVITISGMGSSQTDITKYSATIRNATYSVRMKVNSHNYAGGNNEITVRFPGGFMGTYKLLVQHDDFGTLESNAAFRIGAKITSVSPKTGSVAGGTLITVTGQDFDVAKSFIYFGYRKCATVGTPTTTQLQCMSPVSSKTDDNKKPIDSEVQIAVVTDITDDVTCASAADCRFRWLGTKTSEVTSSSIAAATITINGAFTAGGNYEVKLGGLLQQVDTVVANKITATLKEVSTSYSNLVLSVREVNKGYALLPVSAAYLRPPDPVYTQLAPNIASEGGTQLTITGNYFPKDYKGELKRGNKVVCTQVQYVSMTEMKCTSQPLTASNYSTKLYSSTKKTVSCGSCYFKTDSSLNSEIASLTSSYTGTTLTVVLTGTAFPTGGAAPSVKIGNITATSAIVDSATQITTTFTNGAGFVLNAPIFALFNTGHVAVSDQVSYSENITATVASTTGCSFKGGCEITLTGTNIGLDQHLNVTLAGYKCAYTWDANSITQNQIKCILPALPTKYSATLYPELADSVKWHTSQNVQANSTNVTDAMLAYDQDPVTETSSNGNCTLGFKTTNSHLGTVESVRFLVSKDANVNLYFNGVFQVSSDDGATWNTIYTVESPPREGWNTLDNNCAAPTNTLYNFVRFRSVSPGGCDFLELEVIGKIMHSNNANSITLNAVLSRLGVQRGTVQNVATFSAANTPIVSSTDKKYVNINQATSFTITGSKFGTTQADVAVRINGKAQTVQSVTDTTISVTSVTNCAPSNKETTFQVQIKGKGLAVTQSVQVLCTYYWTDANIWNGEFAPGTGDSVVIPKGMHLIMNADIVPRLRAVIVQGSLIFLPHAVKSQTRYFSADYIFVDGGLFEVGTEASPYDSKIIFTLYGNQKSASIPIYGNKVLACRHCTLDIHGVDPNKSWLQLYSTANPDDQEITLNTTDNISWNTGDKIVIAPTSFNFREAEECGITSKSRDANNRVKLALDCKLKHQHYAGVTTYGSDTLDMRAEVGLLSRNVKFQGDPTSSQNKYGAHIMVHSPGDETSIARIENTEFENVGQGFKLGRYPIHFHMIGFVRKSYIKRNAVHHTFNRAVTIHGVHCLRVEDNVAYHTMGHTYFIEDAIETRNILDHNLAIRSGPSNSLLNTDTTPASFWITNPNNKFTNNHAAGSMRYGFWFDLQAHSTGPSASSEICPVGEKLGEFDGNVAHSNGRYGLRIFHEHIPRTRPCDSVTRSVASNEASSAFSEALAYGNNPPIPAVYQNYLGYKNGRCAIIAERIGALQFKNIKAADNKQAGIEITLPGYAKLADGFVDNALIVGFSANTKDNTDSGTYRGINTGQRDSFIFRNIKFYNFDGNSSNPGASAFGTCSHCAFTLDGDGFANTYEVSGLSFTSTTNKIKYTKNKTIFYDKDGSLSGNPGNERWLTKSHPHLLGSDCTEVTAALDTSVVCTKPILKLLFYSPNPKNTLQGMKLKVVKIEDIPAVAQGTNQPAWNATSLAKVSAISQNKKKIHWEVQFVAGRTYNLHWRAGIDWEGISIKRSRFYTNTNTRFLLNFNYTDRRDEFHVNGRANIANLTGGVVLSASSAHQFGKHTNNANSKLFSMMVSENPLDDGLTGDSNLKVTTKRCSGSCFSQAPPSEIETITRKWSNPNDWRDDPSNATQVGTVPTAGSNVLIKNTWNMFYDIETNPLHYNKIKVDGRLTFEDPASADKTFELIANQLLVVVGEIRIGSGVSPYKNKAIITLKGTRNSPYFAYSNNINAGNKILFVSGNFTAYGALASAHVQTRLKAKAAKGATSISLEPGLQWKAGQMIAIAPTSYDPSQHETAEIQSYDNNSGATVIKSALQHAHFGAADKETYGTFSYDLRAEVALLTRNIVIRGDQERWGGQMLVAEWRNQTSERFYAPRATLVNVELRRMGQYDTFNSGLRAANIQHGFLTVVRASIHSSQAIALFVKNSHNVVVNHTNIYGTYRNGIVIRGSTNLILHHNLVMHNKKRAWDSSIKLKDFQTAVDICVGEQNTKCHNFTVTNNILTGGPGIGFTAPVQKCGTDQLSFFLDNVVHTYEAGLIAHIDSVQGGGGCANLTRFQAYHNFELGIQSLFNFADLKLSKIVAVDNQVSLNLGLARGDTSQGTVLVEDSLIIGEHAGSLDCTVSQERGNKKIGMFSTYGLVSAVSLPYDYPPLGFLHLGADATRGKLSTVKDVTFAHFNTRGCNVDGNPKIFQIHPEGSDLIMEQVFQNLKLDNIKPENLMFLMDPPSGWANLTDCGDFPCTAPQNILMQFQGTMQQLNAPSSMNLPSTPFQVIHLIDGGAHAQCTQNTAWNAHVCPGTKIATLQFESLDPDKRDRSVQPIYIKDSDIFSMKLNSFMDHVWDGFYTGQIRLSRFISLIHHNPSQIYDITYTGTPPLKQLFEVYGSNTQEFFKLSIDYPNPQLVHVMVGGSRKTPNPLVNGVASALAGDECGQNRWIPQQSILQFTIQGGGACVINLKTVNSVQLTFRVDMTLTQFFASGGESGFVTNLSAALGINTSRIRVLGIYQGSVVVNSAIEPSNTTAPDAQQQSELNQVASTVQNKVNSGQLNLGGAILDFSADVRFYAGGVIPTNNPGGGESEGGLKLWHIAVMVISSIVIVTAIIVLVTCIIRRKRKPAFKVKEITAGRQLQGRKISATSQEDVILEDGSKVTMKKEGVSGIGVMAPQSSDRLPMKQTSDQSVRRIVFPPSTKGSTTKAAWR